MNLTDRQSAIMVALKQAPTPASASEVRDIFNPEAPVQGVGQTLRRLRDQLGLVKSVASVGPKGGLHEARWSFTKSGAAKLRRLQVTA